MEESLKANNEKVGCMINHGPRIWGFLKANFVNRGVQNDSHPYFLISMGAAHDLTFIATIIELVQAVQSYS